MPRHKAVDSRPDGPLQAVAYIRCSSDRQAKQEASLPAQRHEITRTAERCGVVIVKWFEDDGISGKNTSDREGINALLNYCDQNPVDIAYVYDFRRMARNKDDAYVIRKTLHAAKVRLIAITQPSVEDEGVNALLENVYDGIAQMERVYLSRVVKRGQEQAIRDGWWPYPRAPYGYRIIGQANQRGSNRYKLLPDPETSEVVKRIFALQAEGHGHKGIAATLDREGVPSPGSPEAKGIIEGWKPKHVKTIIEDERYTGVAMWEGEVINDAHHPAIIDRATYENAQKLKAARNRNPEALAELNRGEDRGIFRPFLRCSCGGRMCMNRGGSPTERVWYYSCTTRTKSLKACDGMTVKVDDLDEGILTLLERDVLTEENIRRVIEESIAMMNTEANSELVERRRTLEGVLAGIQVQMQTITKAIGAGVLDIEDARQQTDPLRKRREEIRAELAGLPEPKPIPSIEQVDPEAFRQAILENWRHNDIKVQRKSLDRIVVEIRLLPGKALVQYAWKAYPVVYTGRGVQGGPEGAW